MGVEEDATEGAFILSQGPQTRGANAAMSAREEDDIARPIEADHTVAVLSILEAVNAIDLERAAVRSSPRAQAPLLRHRELPRDFPRARDAELAAPAGGARRPPVRGEDEHREGHGLPRGAGPLQIGDLVGNAQDAAEALRNLFFHESRAILRPEGALGPVLAAARLKLDGTAPG